MPQIDPTNALKTGFPDTIERIAGEFFRRFGKATVLTIFVSVYASLQWHSLTSRSGTYDEPMHLTAGYLALAHHDYGIDASHPPLLRIWAATPMVFMDNIWADVAPVHSWSREMFLPNSYRYATNFVYQQNHGERILHAGRAMIVCVGGLLGLLLFSWTLEWMGFWPATFVLGFFVIEPNLFAHASLITTDTGAACFYFGSVYFLWKTFRKYTLLNIVGTSVFVALAMVSKFSAVLLVPTFMLLTALAVWRHKTITTKRACLLALAVTVTTYLVIWSVYGFRHAPTATTNFMWDIDTYFSKPHASGWIENLCNWIDDHRLLPNSYIQGFAISLRHAQLVPSFLAGDIGVTGWWYYFPLAFSIKTPIPLLLLFVIGIACCVLSWKKLGEANVIFVFLPTSIYLGVAMNSSINIGLRHILPVYPFVLLVTGAAILEAMKPVPSSSIRKMCAASLVIWWAARYIDIFPHTLTYFNRLVGGTRGGVNYLTDSNVDWGQHLKALKRWMSQHHVKTINLAYFGTADPAFYEIDRVSLPANMSMAAFPDSPPKLPGYVAISETLLSGVYWSTEAKLLYAGFQALEPVEIVGNTIRIYRIDRWPLIGADEFRGVRGAEFSHCIALADYLVRIKWPDLAKSYFEVALTLQPKNGSVYAKLGTLYLKENNRAAAIASYLHAVECSPDVIKYKAMLGSLLAEEGRNDEARKYITEWVRSEPDCSEASYCLGAILIAEQNFPLARSAWQRALDLDPSNEELRNELNRLKKAMGEH